MIFVNLSTEQVTCLADMTELLKQRTLLAVKDPLIPLGQQSSNSPRVCKLLLSFGGPGRHVCHDGAAAIMVSQGPRHLQLELTAAEGRLAEGS